MVMSYIRSRLNATFQQDNARPYVARIYMSFLCTQGILLLCRLVRSPDLSPIENIWPWIAERLARHSSPANMVDEVWHRLEIAWTEFPLSVTKAQFKSMYSQVRVAESGKSHGSYSIHYWCYCCACLAYFVKLLYFIVIKLSQLEITLLVLKLWRKFSFV